MKVCSCCGEEKDLLFFYKKTKTSYRNPCKECSNKISKLWRKNNPEATKLIKSRHHQKYKNKQVENQVKYQINNPEKHLYNAARGRAMKFGIEFDIEVSDVVIPSVCPVFGVEFKRGTPYAASLDRVDSSLGYIKGNVQVISRLANTMKSNATQDQLNLFSKWVLNNE